MWGRGTLATTRKFFAAMNSGDAAACARLMHENVRYVDSRGNAVEGIAVCTELLDRLFRCSGNSRIEVHSITPVATSALVRGRLVSQDPRLDGPVLWRVQVDGGLVRDVEAHRPDARATARLLMPDYLDRIPPAAA